eukprot:CAMPEP_0172900122 /NCGR_PEP_ID=MMETSP1075-20121228/163349_1 /TAXON_ID=2916 /ORGANISM="Ceratium fusus, Strain PA161109" /LENGTH=375 /DNA_ID=CAMNT_0013756241 /DNA_START=65 /DNA_END=1190 /DNA_ORIENTATION=+
MAQNVTEGLFSGKRRLSAPGTGFKVKTNGGNWREYCPALSKLLRDQQLAGTPEVKMMVGGHMYSFDFRTQKQTNLDTGEVSEMRMPHTALRPQKANQPKWKDNLNKIKENVAPQRSIFIMRVPNKSAGKTVKIPHPRKREKMLPVKVPSKAVDGQLLYVPVPPPGMKKQVACLVGGGAGAATTGAIVAVCADAAVGEAVVGGAAAVGAGLAGLSAPPVLAGAAVALGTLAVAGAGVHYATRHPKKAAVVGLLAIGGLAAADHVAEVGVVEAGSDLAAAAGDVVDGAVDAVRYTGRAVQEATGTGMRDVGGLHGAPESAPAEHVHGSTADFEIDWLGDGTEEDWITEGLDILEDFSENISEKAWSSTSNSSSSSSS